MENVNLAKLSEYDFTVVLDRSGSMAEPIRVGASKSRWDYMQESLVGFARDIEKIDTDGINLIVYSGAGIECHENVTADKVKEVLAATSPRGGTPTSDALREAFKLAGKSSKKDHITVFTDGQSDNFNDLKEVIIAQANSQETDDACTVLFAQVGDDAGATQELKLLDDGLTAKFDIVDVKTIEQMDQYATTTDLIAHSIND